jgi:sporulation protein YlmC with PRC-barrel domain
LILQRSLQKEHIMTTATGHTQAIQASRVIGTSVYNTEGQSIGTIEDVMLDKLSNNIMFAVIGFGGFLGIGEKYHAIPWSALDYERDRGGYVVPFSKEQLEAAPVHDISDFTAEDGTAVRDRSYDYYNIPPYWI